MNRLTMCLVTYNQEKFIKKALESILNQDIDADMDIIVSDDCSTDNTFRIIKEVLKIYDGRHNVYLNQNTKNLGVVEHINYVIDKFVKTKYLIICAGDDIQSLDRARIIMEYWQLNPDVYAICNNAILIDEYEVEYGLFIENMGVDKRTFFDVIEKGTQFFGAGAAYRTSIFDAFGKMSANVRNEDQILSYRASIIGDIGYIPLPLLKYRFHSDNLSFWVRQLYSKCDNFIDLDIKSNSNKIINFENLIKEIELLAEYKIDKIKIINLVERKIHILKMEIELMNSNFFKRLRILMWNLRNMKRKHFLIALNPYLYCLYKKAFFRKKLRM